LDSAVAEKEELTKNIREIIAEEELVSFAIAEAQTEYSLL